MDRPACFRDFSGRKPSARFAEQQRQGLAWNDCPYLHDYFSNPEPRSFPQITTYLRLTLVLQGMHVEDAQKDKMKLLGWALAIMVTGLACLFTVVMLEVS